SNIAPRETHDMVMKFLEGHVEESRAIQLKYLEVIRALFCEVNPIPVKKAMELMGLCGGTLRLPLIEMTKDNTERLRKAMLETGIL
ncbi:MAG: dihydrodipicolinate synthase family protein, partial [Clostridiales bacterium]|nr:dihydrodipicolinate synthase family protein [Clostridiales bacterium]